MARKLRPITWPIVVCGVATAIMCITTLSYFQPTPQHRTRAGYVEACSRDGDDFDGEDPPEWAEREEEIRRGPVEPRHGDDAGGRRDAGDGDTGSV